MPSQKISNRLMPRFYYSLILILLTPVILLRLGYRSIANPSYRRRIGERFGFGQILFTTPEQQPVLVHGVSVGEVMAAAPLVEELISQGKSVLITTMTPTGSDTVKTKFGDKVQHCYLPYDLPWIMSRFLNRAQPELVILMETELWPNLIHASAVQRRPVILANARMSERSSKGYSRFSKLTKQMLSQLTYIAAQSSSDAERLIGLGASPEKVKVTGSLKFNLSIAAKIQSRDSFMQSVLDSKRPVVIAASTREGEEEKVLSAFNMALVEIPNLLLVLVPRHLERFNTAAELIRKQGLGLLRRTDMKLLEPSHQVFLGDSMGEMMSYYRLARIAFVGGSLVDTGCQNVLEPAALGIPVLAGPSQYNFEAICQQLEAVGGMKTVYNERELANTWIELLKSDLQLRSMGQKAEALVKDNQQALPKLMAIIEKAAGT